MKIGIFPACLGKKDAGPETYERELLTAIAAAPGGHEYHVYYFNEAAKTAVAHLGDRMHLHSLWPASRMVSLTVTLPWLLARHNIQAYHATFVPAPFCRTKTVFTMHDVSPFTHPQFYPETVRRRLTALVRRGLKTAKVVICISEHCRATTAELFGLPPERMCVVPHGISPAFHPLDKTEAQAWIKNRFGISTPYLLYVGKLEARKNICRLLRAFHQFRQECRSDLKLVLAGRRFWDLENLDQTIAELGIRAEVVELGYVGDHDLVPLYRGAEIFLFPSLYEGFGFPILEAMKCGTPVITSNVSCLPEIAGGAAVLVDPASVQQLADAIGRLFADPGARSAMVHQGVVQAAKFTWEATARQTVAAYERAAVL
jgi:glycosyltransferase involved in cell wall biosynthesis